MKKERESWGSSFGFLMAAVGSAVGSGVGVAVTADVGSAVAVGVTVATLPVAGDTVGSEPTSPGVTLGETEGSAVPTGLADIKDKEDVEVNSTFFATKYCPV